MNHSLIKVTLKSSQRLYIIIIMKPYFYCKKKCAMIYWIILPKAEEGFIELNQCQVNNSWLEAVIYTLVSGQSSNAGLLNFLILQEERVKNLAFLSSRSISMNFYWASVSFFFWVLGVLWNSLETFGILGEAWLA